MEQPKAERIDIETKAGLELPKIDIGKHIGKECTIEKVETYKGQFGYYVKVESEVIEVLEGGKEPIELRASAILGLHEDDQGNVGWNEDTKLGKFLRSLGVDHWKELEGKKVQMTSKLGSDGKTEFLTFRGAV